MSKKHFNFKSSIRDWYIRAFPSDELGYRINPLATFAGAVKCMADGGDIYKYLGVGDSLVRENVFSKIAAITGVDYDAVYDLWLHHDEDECSRLIFLGDHPDCAVDRDWREQFDEVVSPSEQVRYDELLAAEEHRKAETFDSFMEVNDTPMDEVRSAGIALMLMQGIVFAEIARNIDGPSEELDERIATFNRDLKRLYNEPLHKKVEQIESQVGKLGFNPGCGPDGETCDAKEITAALRRFESPSYLVRGPIEDIESLPVGYYWCPDAVDPDPSYNGYLLNVFAAFGGDGLPGKFFELFGGVTLNDVPSFGFDDGWDGSCLNRLDWFEDAVGMDPDGFSAGLVANDIESVKELVVNCPAWIECAPSYSEKAARGVDDAVQAVKAYRANAKRVDRKVIPGRIPECLFEGARAAAANTAGGADGGTGLHI